MVESCSMNTEGGPRWIKCITPTVAFLFSLYILGEAKWVKQQVLWDAMADFSAFHFYLLCWDLHWDGVMIILLFDASKVDAICSCICVLKCQISVSLLSARHMNIMNNDQICWWMFDVTIFNRRKFECWMWWKFGPWIDNHGFTMWSTGLQDFSKNNHQTQ